MSRINTFGLRLIRDERGTEVIEYALLLGMVVCACLAIISTLGTKVVARWNRVVELI